MEAKGEKRVMGGLNRRQFIKTSAVAVTAAALAGTPRLARKAVAAEKDSFLIGHPNPSTGPLADFGDASPWADERVLAAVNAKGGIYLEEYGKQVPLKLKLVDTESDPTKAAELAGRLVSKDKVDFMVTMHTPDTVNPVTSICERYQMPCVSMDAPVESWLTGGPYKWSFHSFFTVKELGEVFFGMWDEWSAKTNKTVGLMLPNDPDGVTWADWCHQKLPEKGYKVVDPGRFPFFNKDYSSIINAFKQEKADIVFAVVIPPDWTTAWRQCHQMGFIPKIATPGKAMCFPATASALGGDLAHGLTVEMWWSPSFPFTSALTGETAAGLCEAWSADTGKQWVQPLGFKYAGFEIVCDVMMRVKTLDKEKIRQAIAATDLKTVVGRIKYNDQNYCDTPIVCGQWVKGKKWPWELEVVYNKGHEDIPKTAEMIFPIPGATV